MALLWEGALDLQLNLEPDAAEVLLEDQAAARCVLEVCREAITNAVKHGSAEQVRINISKGQGLVEINAENDGIQMTKENSGQGINLYTEVTHRFSLENRGEGVMLTLELPISVR